MLNNSHVCELTQDHAILKRIINLINKQLWKNINFFEFFSMNLFLDHLFNHIFFQVPLLHINIIKRVYTFTIFLFSASFLSFLLNNFLISSSLSSSSKSIFFQTKKIIWFKLDTFDERFLVEALSLLSINFFKALIECIFYASVWSLIFLMMKIISFKTFRWENPWYWLCYFHL